MTFAQLFGFALAMAGGIAVATQAPINAALGRTLGGMLPAAAVSFAVGFAALVALVVLTGQAGTTAVRLSQAAPWQVLGGLLGAFYVWSIATAVPSLGVVSSVAALVLGQMAAAMVIDHVGALGIVAQPITPSRVVAVILVAAGLVLSRI